MNQRNKGFALLTKWTFEANEDPESPSTISTGDVAGEESDDGLEPCIDSCLDAIENPDPGGLDWLKKGDSFVHEADAVGGWIVEIQAGARKKLDLFDPDAPSKERIARSYRLKRLDPLLLF